VDALVRGDIGTVEKLGSMTPEQLEALEGIDEESVGRIQQAINSFYGQEYYAPESEGAATAPSTEEPAGEAALESGSDNTLAADAESSSSDRIVQSAETAAEAGVEDESAAESGEEQVPQP